MPTSLSLIRPQAMANSLDLSPLVEKWWPRSLVRPGETVTVSFWRAALLHPHLSASIEISASG
jgi:hypothetical protein